MTGFGSADGTVLGGRLRVEIRTVNHRYYNPQLKLVFELGGVEGQLRERLRQLLERGHVVVTARWVEPPPTDGAVAVDLARARQVVAAAHELKKKLKLKGEIDLGFVARQPDVLSTHTDGAVAAAWSEVEPIVAQAAQEVLAMRAREGRALATDLTARLAALEAGAAAVAQRAPARLAAELARRKQAVAELAAGGPVAAPRVVVLAAPSGGGKTTIANELRRRLPTIFGYSVSATTRKPRTGERDGEDYYFLTREEFQRRVRAGDFLEWAEYAGELYGTLQAEVARVLAGGKHVVLDIEVKGAQQVRTVYPRPASVSIFVIPPSPRVLIERLRKRRTESEQELRERLAIAVREVETARADVPVRRVFDHILVNDDLDAAVNRVIEWADAREAGRPVPDMAARLADFVRELEQEAGQLRPSARRST